VACVVTGRLVPMTSQFMAPAPQAGATRIEWCRLDTLACIQHELTRGSADFQPPLLNAFLFLTSPARARQPAAAMFGKVFAWVLIVVFFVPGCLCFPRPPHNLLHAHSRYTATSTRTISLIHGPGPGGFASAQFSAAGSDGGGGRCRTWRRSDGTGGLLCLISTVFFPHIFREKNLACKLY